MKVVKFGGSSLASGRQIKKVFDIVMSDPERKIVVVSAPGKRFAEDVKVTDLLIKCAYSYLKQEDSLQLRESILERYSLIADELGLSEVTMVRIEHDLVEVLEGDKSDEAQYIDAVKACGEDNLAKLVAAYFEHNGVETRYINPRDAGLWVSDQPGDAQVLPEAYDDLYKLRDLPGIIVFPGFFGYSKAGKVYTFSRSGSDITGSILASAVKATLYENFTDVDAVYAVSPHIVNHPKEIKELTFREMRELSYAGFSVFHDEALIPAYRAGIPVNIKNTNNPKAPGTRIVNKRENTNGPVIGIASDEGFCSIYMSKYLMNKEVGFGRKVLNILEDYGITYEHVPSGIDDMSVILRQNQLNENLKQSILQRIKKELQVDEVYIECDLALLMVVGEGMRHNVGTTARASNALAKAEVNIEMINQGSSEVSMMFGVKETDEARAVQALYDEFFVNVASSTR